MADLAKIDEFIQTYDTKLLPFMDKCLSFVGGEDKENEAEAMFDEVSKSCLKIIRDYIHALEAEING